jgi:hypothetical protein
MEGDLFSLLILKFNTNSVLVVDRGNAKESKKKKKKKKNHPWRNG